MRYVLGAFLTMVGLTFFGFGLAGFLGFDQQTGANVGFAAGAAVSAIGLPRKSNRPHGPEEA